jgi:hypothetical protein
MRAKIKDAEPSAVTVGSELGFLRVGKQLELEDAQSGDKRPASIERVDVAVDPESRIPQLVVTLRYADSTDPAPSADLSPERRPASKEAYDESASASAPARADDLKAVQDASVMMKGAVAHNIARIGPAIERLAQRAKTTLGLLAKRRKIKASDEASAARRTTAPPPGGGLHAAGRRVVRGESNPAIAPPPATQKLALTKRNAAVASAVMIAAILGALALKKAHHDGSAAQAAAAASASALAANAPPAQVAPLLPAPIPSAAPAAAPADSTQGPSAFPAPGPLADNDSDSAPKPSHKKHAHPTPFANGPVHHGNVLHLKMDGAIEAIEGAQQPTGFTVKLPGRKSLEAAGPLAARDARIATIKVSNESSGAELVLTFKDGVPNYQVSGRGDTLVIAIAPVGTLDKTVASKDGTPAAGSAHGRTADDKSAKHPKHHKHDSTSADSDDKP